MGILSPLPPESGEREDSSVTRLPSPLLPFEIIKLNHKGAPALYLISLRWVLLFFLLSDGDGLSHHKGPLKAIRDIIAILPYHGSGIDQSLDGHF